ncbi:MAG: adenosylcobalamin-dependent ribonucleoside-diphosphate reductase [Dehalococcoidia bacterium]|nr:adenosylcobalamin-dependent ribonucleoside-diphosphate reductase [Dehalococcoidia bacterium]
MVVDSHVERHPVELTDNARTVLERRYLLRDPEGMVAETPEGMLARVAEAIAAAEPDPSQRARWAQRFYDEMAALRFLPNSPTLMNAGTERGTLAACFVLPVEDSLDSIMHTAYAAAMVQKYGGGTGFSLSRLRRVGAPIASTHGAACGPLSVLYHYDDVSRLVTQGGKREGANMAVLRVDHPDIRAFIHAKDDGVSAQRFNISVGVTDAFMHAVAEGARFDLRDPHSGAVTGSVDARALFEELTHSAWLTGDPGLVFLDEVNRRNPTPALGDIEATNPCGEVPLLPWEACTLGSINVARFWRAQTHDLDWTALAETVALAVRFLDDIVEANHFPLEEIANAVRGNRKIGLGVMGFADLLIAAGLAYDSEAALALARRLATEIGRAADAASIALAEERGVFPNWDRSVYADPSQHPERPRFRNATRTCIAPTGTIAIIAGASSGIEPLFSLAHYRRMGDGTLLAEVSEAFEAAVRARGCYSDGLMEALAHGARLADREDVPADLRRRFATAHEVAPEWHVRMQAAFQAHTDLAVSKTVNLPRGATPEAIGEVFTLGHELGCKGVTVYRDGSREVQVLAHEPAHEPGTREPGVDEPAAGARPPLASGLPTEPQRRHLPDERQAVTHKFRVGEQEGYVTVGLFEDGSPGEVFITMAKEGSTASGLMDAVAMMTSLSLQYGVSLEKLAAKFEHTRFEPHGLTTNPDIPVATSVLDYIFRWLRLRFATDTPRTHPAHTMSSGSTCPDCGSQLEFVEGCLLCRSCGYNRCG